MSNVRHHRTVRDSNLLVTLVIALAAYGAFDLVRRFGKYLHERRSATRQASLDEEAYWAYAREHEGIRAKFDPEKKWNEATELPGAYVAEMRALNFRFSGMLRRRNGWTDNDFEEIAGDA
jgi:hypothetical protein